MPISNVFRALMYFLSQFLVYVSNSYIIAKHNMYLHQKKNDVITQIYGDNEIRQST
jgi:hypothetical protein